MQLRLIAVGRIREAYVAAACADFRKRLAPYYSFEELEVRAADGSDATRAMREEADRVVKFVRPGEPVWLLDRAGTHLSSVALSERMTAVGNSGAGRLTLIVAGTYGAGERLRERADFLWSLSELTFLHEWARAIVLEQLYRAAKIARNEPYHH
ncbi:MAG: 23S rRNA (pseudouridine(1915)-N(3))-methyltransferase RlmH [Candidatus Eremiobacteraeota bacterium]|nr:23S rRNA (pseudouridine(1915)-N(3))-methyltransferase RlmH [Candidatus Eremiobacteraeota bacterium]